MKIRITELDKKFSWYIRDRDNWTCQRCWKPYTPPTRGLQVSHFWGRRCKALRYSDLNCVALCFRCHQSLTENPGNHVAFFQKRLGAKYNVLMIESNSREKPDYVMLDLWLTHALKGAKVPYGSGKKNPAREVKSQKSVNKRYRNQTTIKE